MFADLDVTTGETSEQALALVRRMEPDVVLFDLGAARQPAVAAQSLDLLRQILQLSPGYQDHRHDGARRARARRRRRGPRGGRLLLQAARCRGAVHRRAARVPHPRARGGEHAGCASARAPWRSRASSARAMRCAASAARSRRWRPPAPRCSFWATAAPARSSSPAPCTASPGARTSLRRHQLRGHPRYAARERALRLREGRLHRRGQAHRRASWKRPTAARYSSTRSARCPRPCRRSCCVFCRSAPWSASAAAPRSRSTCASSAPPTASSKELIGSGALSRGPLLPHQRGHHQRAGAARPAGGQPPHRASAAAADVGALRQDDPRTRARCHPRDPGASLARATCASSRTASRARSSWRKGWS